MDAAEREKDVTDLHKKFKEVGGFVKLYYHQEDNENILICYMNLESGVKDTHTTYVFTNMSKLNIKRSILVSNKKILTSAEKQISYLETNNEIYIEYFKMTDLLINITHHELVPKHIKCSLKDKEIVMKKYRVKESQLPKILSTDPMARYLGVKKKDLVKIIRKSETAGLYVVYRIVV